MHHWTTLLLLITCQFPTPTRDWPHWRGPNRNGLTSQASGFAGGGWISRPAWSACVGDGTSSPLIAQDRVYVLGRSDQRDQLVCLDLITGKQLWKVEYPCPLHGRHHIGDENFYAGPTATPEYDPESKLLYTLSSDGDLNCWDTQKNGAAVWGFNLYDRYSMPRRPKVGTGGQQRDYGYTSAPLIHGDWLLVEVGGKRGTLMAFDRRSGKEVWASQCQDVAGHTGGPAPMQAGEVPCVVVLTPHQLVVIRLDKGKEGKTLGNYPWATEWANNIAGPAVSGNSVLVTSAYNRKAIARLDVTPEGINRVWEKPYPSKACTPVVHKGHVYFAWQKVRCLDWQTGNLKWEGSFVGDPGSCVVTADDRLIVWGQNGRLLLAETAQRSPTEYRELARLDRVFDIHAWPHVAVGGDHLLVKDRRGNLKCFRLPRSQATSR